MTIGIFVTYTMFIQLVFNNSIDSSDIFIDIYLNEENIRSFYDRSGFSYIISKDSSSDSKCGSSSYNELVKKDKTELSKENDLSNSSTDNNLINSENELR